jgi:hypothetical protein
MTLLEGQRLINKNGEALSSPLSAPRNSACTRLVVYIRQIINASNNGFRFIFSGLLPDFTIPPVSSIAAISNVCAA